jgi:hypothetical protein
VSRSRTTQSPASFDAAAPGAVAAAEAGGSGGVDRNTSVRSVMTLPPYRPNALHNEQVLGREGERGGIDVVVEFPETAENEEAHREEEMEALYQVRVARRTENADREERRRLRREARANNDWVALRELQSRARAASGASAGRSVDELRSEHERLRTERQRAVSSVSYGDLGVARHDGTRVRANSVESERQGLLGDAASIAASSRYHRRDQSTGSVLSIDTMNSDMPSPGLTGSRANSRPESPHQRLSSSQPEVRAASRDGRAGSIPEIIEHDLGEEDIPPNSPPGYENVSLDSPQGEDHHTEPPPDYSSPILDRGETGPPLEPRTRNHVGQLVAERRSNSGGLPVPGHPTMGERRSSRGVGGVPQLPSLRLGSLPSIVVDSGSPAVGRRSDEAELP